MLLTLIGVGRTCVAICAIVFVLVWAGSGVAGGYALANAWQIANPTALIFVGAIVGAMVGMILAGVTFGVAAAIFDIQRTIHMIAVQQGVLPQFARTLNRHHRVTAGTDEPCDADIIWLIFAAVTGYLT